MQRCRTCEASMTQTEKQCLNCGGLVPDDKPKFDSKARFLQGIGYFMKGCAVITVLSLFMNIGPSFMTCAIMTVVLGLVKSSMSEMMIDREKE